MDPLRAQALQNTLAYVFDSGIHLSELVLFVLNQYFDPSHPALRDLVENTTSIASAFYFHPAISPSICTWAHNLMCVRYSNAVQALSMPEQGWHFGAMHTGPEQIRDFRIEDMASTMQATTPELWSLVQALLGAGDTSPQPGLGFQVEHDRPLPGSRSGVELESDSDGEYWEVEEMAASADIGQGASGGDDPGVGASGTPKPSARGRTSGSQKKRQRQALRGTFARIKTAVILSILMQTRDPRCNALQSVIGVFLHSCNAPEKVVKVLSRMGVSISLSSIHRAVRSLSNRSYQDIQRLGRSLRNTYAFDNFDMLLKVLIHTIDGVNGGLVHMTSGTLLALNHATREDLRCSDFVWNRSELNPHATDPKPFIPRATMRRIYKLYQESDGDDEDSDLGRSGRFRAWVFMRDLFQYGPAYFSRYKLHLPDPEPVERIPVKKTEYVPLRAMDINQSTVAGNIDALREMFKQAGVGDPRSSADGDVEDISEFMTIVFGDLGTYERILSALRRRSIEKTPYNRLQSVAFGIGYFHLKMAAADTLWRLLVSPSLARQDDTSFMKIAGRLRPNESSRLVSGATFRQQHELINHVGALMRLDAWRAEVKRRKPHLESLEAWADTKPSLADIGEIADCLVRDYAEGEGLDLYGFSMHSAAIRDEVRENTMRTHHYVLLYEELSYAMNAGDIGRLEALLAQWIPLFRAAGKHKYGNYTLRFMHDLYEVYPETLRRAIRMNILVNPTGEPNEFRAVDWVVEFLNLLIKVTYGGEGSNCTKERILLESVLVRIFRNSHANMERNFALPGLTTRHARKDMKATFSELLKLIEESGPNIYKAGRKSNYVIPDAIVKGAAVIEKDGGIRGDGDTWGSAETSTAQGGREVQEGDLQAPLEVSADDLSVEASL